MEYKKLSHCIYHCDYHVVIVTKYRKKIFNEGIFRYFEERIKEIRKYHPEIEFKEVNHDKDHIHMLISIPPKMSVGKVVGKIKSNLGRDLKKKFPFIKEAYWGTESFWSGGYFVSTVGVNEEIIRSYIQK